MIINGRYNDLPLFSQIKTVIAKNQSMYFLVENLKTVEYLTNINCYKLQEIETMCRIIDLNNLKYYWPCDLYCFLDEFKYIIPKYFIY